jgi:hypothetical protein
VSRRCMRALRKYYDPKSAGYKKSIYLKWLKANFDPKDVAKCQELLEIDRHAEGVTKGIDGTYDVPVKRNKVTFPAYTPPSNPKKKMFYDAEYNTYFYETEEGIKKGLDFKKKRADEKYQLKRSREQKEQLENEFSIEKLKHNVREYNKRNKGGKPVSKHDTLLQEFMTELRKKK